MKVKRINILLDENLVRQGRIQAAIEQTSLTGLIHKTLRNYLSQEVKSTFKNNQVKTYLSGPTISQAKNIEK